MPSTVSLLVFYVNGKKIIESHPEPQWTLLYYLRSKLRLCGTKLGCGEGGCGACTVMVSKYNRDEQRIEHFSVNACLAPVCSMHGLAVTTVEGIGSTKDRLHPVQERIYKSHGSQCGFCTPGIVMSMYTLLRNKNVPNIQDIKDNLQGNLCRCTGYRPILQGFKSFTVSGCCGNGSLANGCCKNGNGPVSNGCCKNGENDDVSTELVSESDFLPYDPSQEPIFPPELQISSTLDKDFLAIEGQGMKWFRPTTLEQLLELKSKFPEAKLIVGNTEVGIEIKFKNCNYSVLIDANVIPELNNILEEEDKLVVGGSVSLSRIEDTLREIINNKSEYKTRILAAFLEMLRWFAGKQIRNVASLAGNITTASPISDLNPLLMAAGAEIQLVSKGKSRTVKMDENFFLGYRKTLVEGDEILKSVSIPYCHPNEFFFGFKQAQRREDDIAIVNAGMRVLFHDDSDVIQQLSLAFGGMAPTTVMANKTMEALCGKHWNNSMITEGCRLLLDDLPLDPGAPGGMVAYRRTLTLSFFFKFYLKVLAEISKQKNELRSDTFPQNYKSAITNFHQDPPKASQIYQIVPSGQRSSDAVGRPIAHQSGALHATGEAVYCNDIPEIQGELHMAFVLSSRAHARILSIDPSSALALKGVRGFFSSKDLPGERNAWGVMIPDEEFCASDKVTCQGQIIACVVAIDKEIAQKAARLVRIEYEDLKPVIITIEDAIAADSFYDSQTINVHAGDVDQGFVEAEHSIEGEMRIGGQEHFYLETQCGNAIPKGEHDEIEVIAACQSLHLLQKCVANALGIPINRVVAKAKRLGGGFGGKEIRCVGMASLAALAASKLQCPVRYMLDRDDDMAITGGRHPFLVRYKVGFTSQGKITALRVKAFNNGGHVLDVSSFVMGEFIKTMDNAYKIENVEITGLICKTNLPTNTAFRGFGSPQAVVVIQTIMNDITLYLNRDPLQISVLNMYVEGDKTILGQELSHCTVERCWNQCLKQSDYHFKRRVVDQFNRENRWKKRGLAVVPMKYGIGYPILALNQGAALVHIYLDGTVLVTHGGVEMGQGLHTKVLQVASRTLGIPIEKIHLSETSTDKVPNATQTAASMSTDLFATAVMKACQELKERLDPIVMQDPKAKWEDWIRRAYENRISLSATGFHKTPEGKPFLYYSFGAACSEVEIDCLTGDHQVLRTDIVMDVGDSINPAIDIGQIEGGFIQGYGLHTMEELKYSPQGYLWTRGPGTYKIPGFGDIPSEFNVSLLKGSPNVHAIYSSKAIGEPPLLLASSVFMAIKDAIRSARTDAGLKGIFRLDSPATAERIRMACSDQFIEKINNLPIDEEFVPWSVRV